MCAVSTRTDDMTRGKRRHGAARKRGLRSVVVICTAHDACNMALYNLHIYIPLLVLLMLKHFATFRERIRESPSYIHYIKYLFFLLSFFYYLVRYLYVMCTSIYYRCPLLYSIVILSLIYRYLYIYKCA